MTTTLKGRIERLVSDSDYGLVDGGSGRLYLFYRDRSMQIDGLREGELVTFKLGEGRKGPCAEHVAPMVAVGE